MSDLYQYKAMILLESKEYEKLYEFLKKEEKTIMDRTFYKETLCHCCVELNKMHEASQILKTLIKINVNNLKYHLLLFKMLNIKSKLFNERKEEEEKEIKEEKEVKEIEDGEKKETEEKEEASSGNPGNEEENNEEASSEAAQGEGRADTEASSDSSDRRDTTGAEANEIITQEENYVIFTIEPGENSSSVTKKLQTAGLIESVEEYNKYLSENDYTRKLKSGSHKIPIGASGEQIAKILCRLD